MKVITLTNEKGGVGKTTLALHIAAGLALKDKRVLLIDADAQSHCAHQLNIPEFGGLYRLLVQDEEWNRCIRVPEFKAWGGTSATVGQLLLLPSNHETVAIPNVLGNALALHERLQELEGHIDVVVIDTSPTPSLLHSVVYLATSAAIYPAKCEMLSLDGLAKSALHMKQQDSMRAVYGLNPIKLLGVQPTMYTDTNAHNHGLDLIEQHFGEKYVWRPLKQLTVWREREFAKQTLFAYAPTHEATAETWEIVNKVADYAF